MNDPSSSSSTSSRAIHAPSLMESVNTLRSDNKHGLDAFLARAELAKVTRALRARLSYASYKATNNIAHVPFQTLEREQEANARRSSAPSIQDAVAAVSHQAASGALSPRRQRTQSQLMPPPSVPSLYSSLIAKDSQTASKAKSPPLKRSRLSPPDHRAVVGSPKPTRTRSAARAVSPTPTRTSSRRKKARASSPRSRSPASSHSAINAGNGDVDMDDSETNTTELDLNAAAALTSLLNATNPSITGGSANNSSSGSGASVPHSPTPSHASSTAEAGPSSAHTLSSSYTRHPSHFSQSTMSASSGVLSPRMSGTTPVQDPLTPEPAADKDVAEMMIYLATSPSPARLTARKAEGTSLLARTSGRVLFPTTSGSGPDHDGGTAVRVGGPSTPPGSVYRRDSAGVGIGEPGPSRQPAYSMSAIEPPRYVLDAGPGASSPGHTRTKTAPEAIQPGALLAPVESQFDQSYGVQSRSSSPTLSQTATLDGQSQGASQVQSQSTAVDPDIEYNPGSLSRVSSIREGYDVKGKGVARTESFKSVYDDSASQRIGSPMSTDGEAGLIGVWNDKEGLLDEDVNQAIRLDTPPFLTKGRRPSPTQSSQSSAVTPPPYPDPKDRAGIAAHTGGARRGTVTST